MQATRSHSRFDLAVLATIFFCFVVWAALAYLVVVVV